MAGLDADRALALTYVPARKRAAVEALWRLDVALGNVLAGGREPIISQIKLAWWRDSLEKLDSTHPPAEPVLEAIAKHVLPFGVAGGELSELEEGWTALLAENALTPAELASYAEARGARLFRLSATLLGHELTTEMERSGQAWALVDLSRHSNEADAASAIEAARERVAALPNIRWPAALRPIGMLAALARRDIERPQPLEPQGSPGRMLRMMGHRISGI